MTMDAATAKRVETEHDDPVKLIGRQLAVLSTREHALLRRMYLTGKPAADGAVIKLLHHAGVTPARYERDYPAWRLLTHVAALLSGTGKEQPHSRRAGFGTALQAAGYSENRLLRLTAARGAALHDHIILAGRMLARAGKAPVNLRTLLDLAGRDPDKAEQARLRIAQDYYAAAARPEGDAK
jgi:CRISPR type I-E-associated protein CasB/Cse2